MSGFLMRGALIEYGSDFMGPIPNVVLFQFNPETLTRTVQIPSRPTSGIARETTQAGEPSIEKITLTAKFSAADEMGRNKELARRFGVGSRLAALEKMVYPSNDLVEAIGAALAPGGGGSDPRQVMPRQQFPRILFIWGPFRILPVLLESMSITEQQYDSLLNPVQAEVSISMSVNASDASAGAVGSGALKYSNMSKEAQAKANQANTAEQTVELIPF